MNKKAIFLTILFLTVPVRAVDLAAEVNSNTCSAVYAISPNCSAERGEGGQTVDALGELVFSELLEVINPSAVIIEIDDYNYNISKLKSAYSIVENSKLYRGCIYDENYGMIYKESFNWDPEIKRISSEFEKQKILTNAVFTTTKRNGRCIFEQVNPLWDNASTNYTTAGTAKIDEAFFITYTKGEHRKTSSVKIVDMVEPFIYYK
jgi:hypothetical protein